MELRRRAAAWQCLRPALMRTAAWLLLPLALGACSRIAHTGVDTVRLIVSSRVQVKPDPVKVAASPYAQALVVWPGGSAVMLLGNVDNGRQSWFSDQRHMLYLRRGVLAGSFGLGDDAADIHIIGDNPLLRLHEVTGAATLQRRYDWRDGYRYGVVVQGELRRRGMETIEILGTSRALVHFSEALHGDGVSGTNHYWADPTTGYIWKSQQLLAPGVMVEITQLKPYRQDLS